MADREILDLAISSIEDKFVDPYTLLDGQIVFKAFVGIYYLLSLATGTLLQVGIISYEKFGGDPQKRGLRNQLFAQVMVALVIFYWVSFLIWTWRTVFGLVPPTNLVWMCGFFMLFGVFWLILALTQILLIKYISIVVRKHVLAIEDDFWSLVLLRVNIGISTMLAFLQCYHKRIALDVLRTTGQPSFLLDPLSSPVKYSVIGSMALALGSLVLIASIALKWQSWKNRAADSQTLPDNANNINRTLNFIKYNADVITAGKVFAISIVSFLIWLLSRFRFWIGMDQASQRLFVYLANELSLPLVLLISYTLLTYVKNKDLRKYVQELYNVRC